MKGVASIDDILANVDTRLSREGGKIDVLMLSGGEPTLHPQFGQLIEALVDRPIVRIMVNTNGLLLADDDALLGVLRKHRQRVEVYLQYDGPSREAGVAMRGGDLRERKERAIDRLSAAGVFSTLVMTITKGAQRRRHRCGRAKALDTAFVGGVALQPCSARAATPASTPMIA